MYVQYPYNPYNTYTMDNYYSPYGSKKPYDMYIYTIWLFNIAMENPL